MIKLSGGKYRSRVIATPDDGTIPTKSMVREAIMSALTRDLPGAVVIDLFAGSGALGLEALSRGAKKAILVDNAPGAYQTILANIALLKEANAVAISLDYRSALAKLLDEKAVFDVVFLDPPYAEKEAYATSICFLLDNAMLSSRAAVVIEYEGTVEIPDNRFSAKRTYNYGRTNVMILRRN